jgi:hypothetical protein
VFERREAVIELAAAIAAVKALGPLVSESISLVSGIRSGMLAKNDAQKRALEQKLGELEQSLHRAGELAWVAAAYSRTYEEVTELLQSCRRADRFVRDNMEVLASAKDADHRAGWKLLDAIFDGVGEKREAPIGTMLDRDEWYDQQDKAQIEMRLRDFVVAFERGSVSIRTKAARDVAADLRAMIAPLEEVEAVLQSTIYDKVLRTLQRLA